MTTNPAYLCDIIELHDRRQQTKHPVVSSQEKRATLSRQVRLWSMRRRTRKFCKIFGSSIGLALMLATVALFIVLYPCLKKTSEALGINRECDLSGRIRLSGGSRNNEGRLEIFYECKWRPVCLADTWSSNESTVACRHLKNSSFPKADASDASDQEMSLTIRDEARCTGVESNLEKCNIQWSFIGISHRQCYAVFLRCDDPQPNAGVALEFRLVGGPDLSRGIVEVFHREQWTAVCQEAVSTDIVIAACRRMGHNTGTLISPSEAIGFEKRSSSRNASRSLRKVDVSCVTSDTEINDCQQFVWHISTDCKTLNVLAVRCNSRLGLSKNVEPTPEKFRLSTGGADNVPLSYSQHAATAASPRVNLEAAVAATSSHHTQPATMRFSRSRNEATERFSEMATDTQKPTTVSSAAMMLAKVSSDEEILSRDYSAISRDSSAISRDYSAISLTIRNTFTSTLSDINLATSSREVVTEAPVNLRTSTGIHELTENTRAPQELMSYPTSSSQTGTVSLPETGTPSALPMPGGARTVTIVAVKATHDPLRTMVTSGSYVPPSTSAAAFLKQYTEIDSRTLFTDSESRAETTLIRTETRADLSVAQQSPNVESAASNAAAQSLSATRPSLLTFFTPERTSDLSSLPNASAPPEGALSAILYHRLTYPFQRAPASMLTEPGTTSSNPVLETAVKLSPAEITTAVSSTPQLGSEQRLTSPFKDWLKNFSTSSMETFSAFMAQIVTTVSSTENARTATSAPALFLDQSIPATLKKISYSLTPTEAFLEPTTEAKITTSSTERIVTVTSVPRNISAQEFQPKVGASQIVDAMGAPRVMYPLEVFYNGTWVLVCSKGLQDVERRIILQELQRRCEFLPQPALSMFLLSAALDKPGYSVLLPSMTCVGNETSLAQCHQQVWYRSTECGYTDSAHLDCG